jgi:hypothetical protein
LKGLHEEVCDHVIIWTVNYSQTSLLDMICHKEIPYVNMARALTAGHSSIVREEYYALIVLMYNIQGVLHKD